MADDKTQISRRALGVAALGVAAAASSRAEAKAKQPAAIPIGQPFILTTWEFGPGANQVGWPILAEGGSSLDAVEKAINYVELLGNYYVGAGGVPNEVGETTLDAMIMWGPTHDMGAVGCLKRVKKAISVARKVMEETQHSLIVGDDATRFAARMGFSETSLTSLKSQEAWDKWAAQNSKSNAFGQEPIAGPVQQVNHDTVGSIALDKNGNLCVGCSTNGREFKIPGRVGDSPIAGAGAYCDQAVGAAVATGNGDVMMRFLPTFHVVELMRGGMEPEAACTAAIKRIEDAGYKIDGGIAAIRRDGVHGGAKTGWADEPFAYSVQTAAGNVDNRVKSHTS